MEPRITTFTGRQVNPLALRTEDVCIEDIAHALALCNRFAGHTRRPISVAQHSVYVGRLSGSLQGLLHDATEAYLGDVTKWLKESPAFAEYRKAEEVAQVAIMRRFECNLVLSDSVLIADRVMCRFEAGREMHESMNHWPPAYPPVTEGNRARIGPWHPWGWRTAEEVFLAEFRLFGLE